MKELPIIYVLDGSVAMTGALKCVCQQAKSLKHTARIVLVLPQQNSLPQEILSNFLRVEYIPYSAISKRPAAMLLYVPHLLAASWKLRQMMRHDGASRLQLNDCYLLHGAVLRLLGYTGHIACWVRCDPFKMMRGLAPYILRIIARSSNNMVAVSRYIQQMFPADSSTKLCYDFHDSEEVTVAPYTETKTFIFIGNYIEGKGQDVALEAFAIAQRQDNSLLMAFHGGDMGLQKNKDYLARLKAQATTLGIANKVFFSGFTQDVNSALAGAYAAINASNTESFSMTVLEASAAGRPVIATESGGPREIIDDGKTGFIVPIGDAQAIADKILWLAEDAPRAQAMGRAGADLVQMRFSQDKFLEAIKPLLRLD